MRLLNAILLTAAHAVVVQYNVTCNGVSSYDFDGKMNPPVTVKEEDTLIFTLDSATCTIHPFEIRNGGGTALTGVVNQGGTSGEITWNVPAASAGAYSYACANHVAMTSTITVVAPIKAEAPPLLSGTPLSTTSANITWTAGLLNDCIFQSWAVVHISPSPLTGAVTGCTGLTEAQTDCIATGLSGTSFAFSVQAVCVNAGANSLVANSASFSIAAGSAVSSVTAIAKTATDVLLSWTRSSVHGACQLASFEVMTATPVVAAVQGCESVGTSLFCLATNLNASTSYTFTVKEVCTVVAFNSPTRTSNTVMTNTAVNVNVTCGNAVYLINGVANANVSAYQGDTIFFNLNGCTLYPFSITTTAGVPYDEGVSNNNAITGVVQLDTNVSTPAQLRYSSQGQSSMTGVIFVGPAPVKAARPGTPTVTTVSGAASLTISWTSGSANDCLFANWLVEFASGSSGAVTGCTSFPNASVTSCTATGLLGSTSYSFTVQRLCTNSAANSPVSFASSSRTTASTVGVKVCQNVNTCNCGNATICTCQLTQICNCENAGQCICQGGVCNGGNAGSLTCNFPTNCNKQCAKSCLTCVADSVSSFFGGSGSCVSGSVMVSASSLLLATLFLLV